MNNFVEPTSGFISGAGPNGEVEVIVADAKGVIKQHYKGPNAASLGLKYRLAQVISATDFKGISAFSSATALGKDGIYAITNISVIAADQWLNCTKDAGGGALSEWIRFSGSISASKTMTIARFVMGNSWGSDNNFASNDAYATVSASVAMVSGDTLSCSWTISVT